MNLNPNELALATAIITAGRFDDGDLAGNAVVDMVTKIRSAPNDPPLVAQKLKTVAAPAALALSDNGYFLVGKVDALRGSVLRRVVVLRHDLTEEQLAILHGSLRHAEGNGLLEWAITPVAPAEPDEVLDVTPADVPELADETADEEAAS